MVICSCFFLHPLVYIHCAKMRARSKALKKTFRSNDLRSDRCFQVQRIKEGKIWPHKLLFRVFSREKRRKCQTDIFLQRLLQRIKRDPRQSQRKWKKNEFKTSQVLMQRTKFPQISLKRCSSVRELRKYSNVMCIETFSLFQKLSLCFFNQKILLLWLRLYTVHTQTFLYFLPFTVPR